MAQSPLQIVKEKFGSKDKLVDTLVGMLEPAEGESKEEFTERLKRVANAKLLHLHGVSEKVKELGGKDKIVAKIAELKGHAKDKDFVTKLSEQSASSLVDMHDSLARKAAKK